jgi:hypothetical protein
MRAAWWILGGTGVFVVIMVLGVVLPSRAISGAWERSSMEDLTYEVQDVHTAALQERRENQARTAHRRASALIRDLENHHNHRMLSTRSDDQSITIELLVWNAQDSGFDVRPILVTCLRVTSTPSTVTTGVAPCSVDPSRLGKLVTTITPLTSAVDEAPVVPDPRITPPCYSGSGRCN